MRLLASSQAVFWEGVCFVLRCKAKLQCAFKEAHVSVKVKSVLSGRNVF